MATTTITASCACRSFNISAELPNESLPRSRALCLCDRCRRVSGSVGLSLIMLPQDQTIEPSEYQLTKYKFTDNVNRYFCSTCGAHVLAQLVKQNTWHVLTGLCDRTEGIVKWEGCKWVEATLDGGISIWLKEINDAQGQLRPLRRWRHNDGENGELVPEDELRKLPAGLAPEGANLKAQCHCGGVKFFITRPNEVSKTATSPYPDIMVPFHLGSSENPHNEPWWLQENDTKYTAGLCACPSCRLASGSEIQPWAFIPKCNIFKEDGSPLDFNMGTLKRYDSSKGIWREFCATCGATVFWHCDWRPELMDVSVGLFDPEQGARAENWLSWLKGRVSFQEMCVSRSLVDSLEAGMRSDSRIG